MKHSRSALRIGTIALSLVVVPPVTPWAATIQWLGTGGSNAWGNPANWLGGVVPGPGVNQADSDLVSILGHLIRGSAGEFRFNLVDTGVVAGQH